MISVHFQGKPFNITVIQVYVPISKAEEVEAQQLYEDLQDLLEKTPKKRCHFHCRGLEYKSRSQETPGVTRKFGLGVQNEAGQRHSAKRMQGHSKYPLSTTQEKTLHMDITRWSTPKSD